MSAAVMAPLAVRSRTRPGASPRVRQLALGCSAAATLIADLAPVALIAALTALGAGLLALG